MTRAASLRTRLTVAVVLAVSVSAAAWAAPPHPKKGGTPLTVMTQNLYFGVDLTPVIAATTQEAFLRAVDQVFTAAMATKFSDRAAAVAREIQAAKPDLVGLQEAVIWRTVTPDPLYVPPGTPVLETEEANLLDLLVAALASAGTPYEVVVTGTSFDIQAVRFLPGGIPQSVRLTDRDAILVRSDRKAALSLGSGVRELFDTALSFNILGSPTRVPRGWVAVDGRLEGREFRFVNTHLEPYSAEVAVGQAKELLAGPTAVGGRIVLVGDFNSDAEAKGAAFRTLTKGNGRFLDTWQRVNPSKPGYTCCQAEDLQNLESILKERIDLILFRGDVRPMAASVLGNTPWDMTETTPPLWPSDHAGVAATLQLN